MFLLEREGYDQSDAEGVILGPSTDNKIERLWRDLVEKVVNIFRPILHSLVEDGSYSPTDVVDREILCGVFIPAIYERLNQFMDYHNNSRFETCNFTSGT